MQVATNLEVRRLNALLRYLQENPQELIFKAMYCDKVIEAHTDSAFTRENETGYGIRGHNILRRGVDANGK